MKSSRRERLCGHRIRVFSVAPVVIGRIVSALYALVSIDGQYGPALGSGPEEFASALPEYNENLFHGLSGTSIEATKPNCDSVSWMSGLATAGILFFTWWFSTLWSGAYLLTIGWALMLWIIPDGFMDLIVADPSPDLLRDIRKFNKVAVLIEK